MKKIPVRTINEPRFSEGLVIRSVEELLSGGDMVQELHRHNFFFVLVLQKGKGEHSIDFVPYPVHDCTVFIMRPGQVHQLTLRRGSTGYLMQFNADFYSPVAKPADQVLRKVSGKNHYRFGPDGFDKLMASLSCVFMEHEEKQERYKQVIKANLEIFFIQLLRQGHSTESSTESSTKAGSSYAQQRLDDLMVLLETHITTCKEVGKYADMMHLTPYQLNAITKETLGKTCSQLINEQIVLEAKRNLLATTNRVNEIALELGYSDTSYFIRFFKKHAGSSPEAYRQNFK
ncbi:helix-turn-helix transcriptional regulator [Fulvivirga kasyanovii]|uniref:AraC family transcriptional regulator n=1 Tax=Fulvivirga kasyanovii TaxID=396812 RepID=A0ABW9RSI0_9BACT|nr:helix-turn-helix transcriptional regulator [Fulvivirga kasyanovii]MTI26815.1 AraC family transcriptional regulator [Fulvivirga kasyanovii]